MRSASLFVLIVLGFVPLQLLFLLALQKVSTLAMELDWWDIDEPLENINEMGNAWPGWLTASAEECGVWLMTVIRAVVQAIDDSTSVQDFAGKLRLLRRLWSFANFANRQAMVLNQMLSNEVVSLIWKMCAPLTLVLLLLAIRRMLAPGKSDSLRQSAPMVADTSILSIAEPAQIGSSIQKRPSRQFVRKYGNDDSRLSRQATAPP